MAVRFPRLKEGNIIWAQAAQRFIKKMNPNIPMVRYAIIKMVKVKETVLKAARKKQRVVYKGISIRLTVDFFVETLPVRREYIQNVETLPNHIVM